MKMKKFLLVSLLTLPALAACGDHSIKVTFHQENAEDVVIKIAKGMTEDQFTELIPEILLGGEHPEGWFSAEWGDYPLFAEITESITVDAEYTPLTYSAKFMNEDKTVLSSVNFTYEDYKADEANHKLSASKTPAVPSKAWYDGAWADYTLEAKNLIINPVYTAHVYTATFKDDTGAQIGTSTFTIDDLNEDGELADSKLAQLEERTGYDASWDNIVVSEPGDVVINAVYNLHRYYVDFYEDETAQTPLGSAWYDMTDTTVADLNDIPDAAELLDEIPGYTAGWDLSEVTLTHSDTHIKVYAKYAGNEYTVSYSDGTSQKVTFGSEYSLKDPKPSGSTSFNWSWYDNDSHKTVLKTGTWDVIGDVTLSPQKYIGFEEANVSDLFTCTGGKLELVETSLVGSKALKFTATSSTDITITLNKDVLDDMFADSSVTALEFRAKGSKNNLNWRYKKPDGSGQVQYENPSYGGLNKDFWKSFKYSREIYTECGGTNRPIIVSGMQSGDWVLLDDFRTCTREWKRYMDMEDGEIRNDGVNPFMTYGSKYPGGAGGTWAARGDLSFQLDSASACEFCSDPQFVKEGYRSIKVTKCGKGELAMAIGDTYWKGITGTISFDVYATFDIDVTKVTNGSRQAIAGLTEEWKANTWYHVEMSTADINSSGRGLIIPGSPNAGGDVVYYDNLVVTLAK